MLGGEDCGCLVAVRRKLGAGLLSAGKETHFSLGQNSLTAAEVSVDSIRIRISVSAEM